MFKGTNITKKNWVSRDGRSKKYQKKKSLNQNIERREWTMSFIVFHWLPQTSLYTYSVILRLSPLFSSSGKTHICCLIPPLTNLLIWAKVELYKSTILSGLGLSNFVVLTKLNCSFDHLKYGVDCILILTFLKFSINL